MPDAKGMAALEDLPGLKRDENAKILHGPIDAVCAAAARIDGWTNEGPVNEVLTETPYIAYDRLRTYQNEGVSEIVVTLKARRGAILADEMGLGKTAQAIHVALALGVQRLAIVCPASVRLTWMAELQKWNCASDVQIITSGSQQVLKPQDRFACVITSYELAGCLEVWSPGMLIIDEAHMLRGRKAKRGGTLEAVAAVARYTLALTGTPVWNRPRDLYRLLHILHGTYVWGTPAQFDKAYCAGHQGEHGWTNHGASREDELRSRLSFYMTRRTKAQVAAELPKLSRQVIWIDGTPEAQTAMHIALVSKAAGATQQALLATLDAKIDAAVDLAVSAGKFLLFTWRKADAKKLAEKIRAKDVACVVLTGDMPGDARAEAAAQAVKDGVGVVATIDSLSVGVNLQGLASVGIFHAIDYVPQKLLQAEARLHRLGSYLPVTWYYIACRDTMDAHVIRTVVSKLDMAQAAVGESDAQQGLRDSLNADIDGGSEAALKTLYESIGEEES